MPDELRALSFDPTMLRDAEAEVITRTARGEIAAFPEAAFPTTGRPVVRAAFLRHLLLGLEAWPIRLPGVRPWCGRTKGTTRPWLTVPGQAGRGVPALAPKGCEIAEPVDLPMHGLARVFAVRQPASARSARAACGSMGSFDFFPVVVPLAGHPRGSTRMRR